MNGRVQLSCGCLRSHNPKRSFFIINALTSCEHHGAVRIAGFVPCDHIGTCRVYRVAVIDMDGHAVGRTICGTCGAILSVCPEETQAPPM